jgi:hypothetical protein
VGYLQLAHGLEQRQVGAVGEVDLRSDRVRQQAADLVLRRPAVKGLAGITRDGMVDADADLGVGERGQRGSAHPVADRAVGGAVDLSVPPVIHAAFGMPPGEPDREVITAVGHGQVGNRARQRVPVQVADRDVDATGYLGVAVADLAQVAAAEQGAHRPGPQ